MPEPLDFYFDFSSPYGYLASCRIDQLAARHERGVSWRPFLLGAVFKVAGTGPLTSVPLKGDYSVRDFQRSARLHEAPFKMPTRFPINGLQASRAFYWLEGSNLQQAKPFARAIFAAYFVDDRDISNREVVADVGGEMGIDRIKLLAALDAPEVKNRLREVTDDAIRRRGVFGSPFIFVDGEPFWGSDRLEMIDRWLATGGW